MSNLRLKGCQRNVEVWQRILKVRSLVLNTVENMEMWIKFANLCRKSGRLGLCQKTLIDLLRILPDKVGDFDFLNAPPQVVYSYLKCIWALGDKVVQIRVI